MTIFLTKSLIKQLSKLKTNKVEVYSVVRKRIKIFYSDKKIIKKSISVLKKSGKTFKV